MQSSAWPDRQASLLLPSNAPQVEIDPPGVVQRHVCSWPGLHVETVTATERTRLGCSFQAPWHLLIVAERGERADGETMIEGLPKSTLRNFSRRMSFVPAGHKFYGWQTPRVLMQAICIYIDPHGALLNDEALAGVELKPRLQFDDTALWHVVDRLKDASLSCNKPSRYGEALGVVLAHELIRIGDTPRREGVPRGGLSGWQQRAVTDYIEANLGKELRLADMASLVRLSPYHFARAFKQSFGVPPHRYHVGRRIARAKDLLTDPANSITGIALTLGFAETSSFSSTFRRVTGASPSDFRRDSI